ncbi:hypothetical protein DRE_04725 [Drechslerella stenobrocha 248]|uniref:rRNA-processing protein n=1 Tax=Drechslerella stenobrocha 248 TaxID=1043628 RepID=W7I0C1_9PEZI|nr:hypothetical protein DRE_04725 [Drechslerella stenobrocha 248]
MSSDAAAPALRRNGKHWKPQKAPFKPGTSSASTTSSKQSKTYAARQQQRQAAALVHAKEASIKAEAEALRQTRIQSIKDKRAAKEERERYDRLAQKMHAKRVERLKRREKRNKLLKER